MKIAAKTMNKVVLEVHKHEMNSEGFYQIWDSIREKFSIDEYALFSIDELEKEGLIYFELKPIKQQ